MLGKSLQTRDRPETLFRVCRCAREHISFPRHMSMRVSLWTVLMTEPCLSVSLFCRCPIYMSMRVSLWAVPVVDVCLRVSLLCGCPRHLSTQVSLRPVPLAGLCGPVVTCFPVGLPSGAGGHVYLSWLYLPYGNVCDDRLRFDPLDRSIWP